jgi:hypothetical protein
VAVQLQLTKMAPRNANGKCPVHGGGGGRRVASLCAPVATSQQGRAMSVMTNLSNIQQGRVSVAMQSSSGPPSATSRSFSEVSRTLKQTPGPPLVVAVNVGGSIGGSTGENQVKVWFEACQNNDCLNNKAMLVKDIITYFWHKLFPKLKFIMNDNQLNYSTDPKTLCALIGR